MVAAPPTTRASTRSISRRLRAVRDARGGKLGFNAKFLVEMGEEIGSPDLNKVCASLRDELKADLLLASDGPRLAADRPTIFLGCRGGIRIHLDVNFARAGIIPAIGADCSPIPRRSLQTRSRPWSTATAA